MNDYLVGKKFKELQKDVGGCLYNYIDINLWYKLGKHIRFEPVQQMNKIATPILFKLEILTCNQIKK